MLRSADGVERIFEINQTKVVIGRRSRCDLQVALPVVGAEHCELTDNGHGLILTDLGSDAGTVHNENRIETATVRHGDRIAIGPIEFIVRDRLHTPRQATEVTGNAATSTVEVVVMPQKSTPGTSA